MKIATIYGNQDIIRELCVAYGMELETAENLIANSAHLDEDCKTAIKKALSANIRESVTQARQLAGRIREIGGRVPGSLAVMRSQSYLQPQDATPDVCRLLTGAIKAGETAMNQYKKIIELCDGRDVATKKLATEILTGEEESHREFVTFSKEFAA
jgi:ferritin-like protein